MSVRPAINSLTGLRFVAAMCVVVSHALLTVVPFTARPPLWYTYITQASGFGMTPFFVLSGFVIHYNYSSAIHERRLRGTYDFLVARFARLYPLYALCLAFCLAATWWHGNLRHFIAPLPYYILLLQTWIYSVSDGNNLIYQYGLMVPVTWSISTEWFFYLAYPAICSLIFLLAGWRLKFITALVLSALIFGAMAIIYTNYHTIDRLAVAGFGPVADIDSHWQDSFIRWLVYFSPYSRIGEFIVGCLTAIFMELQDRPVSRAEARSGAAALAVALVGIAALYRAMFGPPYSGPPFTFVTFLHMSFGFALLSAIVIFCCARYRLWLSSLLSVPSIVQCGEVSYSLYLLHLLVLRAFVLVAIPVTSRGSEFRNLMWMTFAILVTLGVSFVSYNIWENPMRRSIRRVLRSRHRHAAA